MEEKKMKEIIIVSKTTGVIFSIMIICLLATV